MDEYQHLRESADAAVDANVDDSAMVQDIHAQHVRLGITSGNCNPCMLPLLDTVRQRHLAAFLGDCGMATCTICRTMTKPDHQPHTGC